MTTTATPSNSDASRNPETSTASGSPPGSVAHFRAWWAGLKPWGKAATVAVPAAVFLLVTLTGVVGHSSSWKWGYDRAGEVTPLIDLGYSTESACRSNARLHVDYKDSRALVSSWPDDVDDAVAGCLAGLNDMGR